MRVFQGSLQGVEVALSLSDPMEEANQFVRNRIFTEERDLFDCVVLQFFFLIVPSYFSSILVVYLLGEVDAYTPILRIFSFAPYPPFVSLTFPRT